MTRRNNINIEEFAEKKMNQSGIENPLLFIILINVIARKAKE